MLLTSFRRSSRKRFFRAALIAFLFLCALDFFSLVSHHARQSTSSNPSATGEKIFIASIHWNNELVLRSNWTRSVVALAKHLGPANVYVSVYESGSWDDSKGALRQLDEDLDAIGVQRSIILEKSTHLDEINKPITRSGWIETPRGQKELRRIPYLARLRNLSLRPLRELAENGKEFDKVLFLNDVVFTVCSPRLHFPQSFELTCRRHKMYCPFCIPVLDPTPPLAPLISPSRQIITTPSLFATCMATNLLPQPSHTSVPKPPARSFSLAMLSLCRVAGTAW